MNATENKKKPFEGVWQVLAYEMRAAGEWKSDNELSAGQWIVEFMSGGRFFEIHRSEGRRTMKEWRFDESTGIISIVSNPRGLGEFSEKCIFAEQNGESYLCYFDASAHIRPDREIILAHHACKRLKLVAGGDPE